MPPAIRIVPGKPEQQLIASEHLEKAQDEIEGLTAKNKWSGRRDSNSRLLAVPYRFPFLL